MRGVEMSRCTIHIRNNYKELEHAIREITKLLESKGMAPHFIRVVVLGLEEVITNILKYGYDDQQEHQIKIALHLTNADLCIDVTDDGHEFNPLEHPEPDAHKPLEDREPGGLGIFFLRKLFDDVRYRRETGRNILILRKHLEKH
jgi:anti-sigma regulatory factor (Ser/Thr protein kinase)